MSEAPRRPGRPKKEEAQPEKRRMGRPPKNDPMYMNHKERHQMFADTSKCWKLTEEYALEVCEKMFHMIMTDESILDIKEMLTRQCLPQSSYLKLRENFKVASDFHSLAKTIIGARREKLALHGKIDSTIVGRTLQHFDADYLATEMSIKKTASEQSAEFIQQMGEFIQKIQASTNNKLPYKKK